MIPRTINNLGVFEVRSALQKHIRRGEEREAMHGAVEMGHTSKSFFTMLCNALEVIAHEDVGLANPSAVIFTATAIDQAKRHYDADKRGKWCLMIGNAIRILCRLPKSRKGDHFQAALGPAALMDGIAPTIPDYAFDMHTNRGRRKGRRLEYLRTESTKLVPPPAQPDAYEEAAYAVWERKHAAADSQPELL